MLAELPYAEHFGLAVMGVAAIGLVSLGLVVARSVVAASLPLKLRRGCCRPQLALLPFRLIPHSGKPTSPLLR